MERTRVIIADDESLIRMDLREMLTNLGYLVVGEVADGRSAVNQARELRPDVVVMDIKMPDMDGIEAAKILTEERVAPVVLLSAYSQRELVERAREAGVQAMVEGPGHVPLDQVAANVVLQKQVCKGAPFYVLGPLVTDIAPGYDHITSAIGGALAGMSGADFICYVTPSEHLALPGPADVHDGVMAARIAAHAADIVRLGPCARAWDDDMARARRALDWQRQFELAIDPARARELFDRAGGARSGACTMCGDYCVFKLLTEASAIP